ncbi:hypothetical protein [Variovorax rhizosphaerae]|uniref:Uncharacterized protein n=1 Tax=Variovorax rhizosphaerae TaxID=1836200 RepID=A0ABU8WY53_9BURK
MQIDSLHDSFGWVRHLSVLLAAVLFLASSAHAAGNDRKSGNAPTLSTGDFDYYLTGNATDQNLRAPDSQMTVLMGGGLDVDQAFADMIGKARSRGNDKVDVVVIRASGEDGYNEYHFTPWKVSIRSRPS